MTIHDLPLIVTNMFGETVQQTELWCEFCTNAGDDCKKCKCDCRNLKAKPSKFKGE